MIKQRKPDIIALTEIKPKNGDIPSKALMEIPGYELHISELEIKESRGVAVYVKKDIQARTVQPVHHFTDSVWITVQGKEKEKVLFGCIYRSGSPQKAANNDKKLHDVLIWAADKAEYTHKVIVGDFNHPKITWSPGPNIAANTAPDNPECKFVDCILETYFQQVVTQPTRYRGNQNPTMDDLILINEQDVIQKLDYLDPIGASDHIGIGFEIAFQNERSRVSKSTPMYDKGDYARMRTMLDKNWDQLLAELPIQEAWDKFEKAIKEATDICIPTKITNENTHSKKPLWMNSTALRKARRKHSAWVRYLNTKQEHDWHEYIKKRNEATHETRKCRRLYEKKLAKEVKNNNKAFWKYVNSKRKSKSSIGDLLKPDGTYAITDEDRAQTLNDQYIKTFTKEDLTSIPPFHQKPIKSEYLSRVVFTDDIVLKKLTELRTDKTPGPDGLHPRILKEVAEQIAHPLAIIFDLSIASSTVPSQWKKANVCPIFKKGSSCDPANYRPVSLTSIVCKLMERIISEVIVDYVTTNELQCSQQHGFTRGKSTVTNLLEATNIWTDAMSHLVPIDIIYLDYAKAFDTVPHERLLKQVETFGITGPLLNWIRSFLTGRMQRVQVNGKYSTWQEVVSGVPQGSVLGPLLFTLFVSDIPEITENFCSLFADDTKIFTAMYDNFDQCTSTLQQDLNRIHGWTKRMQMKLHPDKCKVMHLGKNNPQSSYTLEKEDGSLHTLKETSHEKDLGVVVDNKLRYSMHIEGQVHKANRVLGAIKHTFKYMDANTLLLLYKSLIRPHLEYASTVWTAITKRDQDALEKVQRRATRLVPKLANMGYNQRLRELKLPTLSYRRQRADAIQIYKIVNRLDVINLEYSCPICKQKPLEISRAENTRGHSLKFQIQQTRTPRCHFLTARALQNWNGLSDYTITRKNVNLFKSGIEKDWKNKTDKFDYNFSY